jgi:hypothetical protein
VELYLRTGNAFHLEMAEVLRQYVSHLKTWIHAEEALSRRQDDH